MNILIKNCTLISMDEEKEQIQENIDILIKNEKIIKIAKNIKQDAEKIIDAKRKSGNARAN